MNDNYGWTNKNNINGCNGKKCKILRNEWKKNSLAIDMVIIKHIIEWENLWDKPMICMRDHMRGTTTVIEEHE